MFMVGNAQTTSGFTRNKMYTFYKYRVGVVCEAFNEVIKWIGHQKTEVKLGKILSV